MTSRSPVKIFLSSTFVDLSEVRNEISRWLAGLFEARLIIMETFGSDAAPPEVNSVRKVRECDLFIGIYAHRYGTIDKATGKSITELELDEANAAHSAGTLSDILLYLVENGWLREWQEDAAEASAGLARLRSKARLHTYTTVKDRGELLFAVIRDAFARINAFAAPPVRIRPLEFPAPRVITRPLGMEYLTSAHQTYLIGRGTECARLVEQLETDPMVLLLGDSGVGKTSLIHAALIPALAEKGYRPIYARPFGFPCTDLARQVLAAVFEGRPTARGPLTTILGEVCGAVQGQRIVLLIDQFEDVLTAADVREVETLVSDLRTIREIATPGLRVLISYRSDLEGRLGTHWQAISGSPSGLPRVYVEGIDREAAWSGLEALERDLGVDLAMGKEEKAQIRDDLLAASKKAGFSTVYPPFFQMLADHIWSAAQGSPKAYSFEGYEKIGRMDGIIGGYLGRQLSYAHDAEGHLRAVLTSLVRSYGIKAQKTLDEIAIDTALHRPVCESAIERLIDLRLVRHIEDYYETAHDFIAKRIASELVDPEELEFKRFRELLASKGGAYSTTEATLTPAEVLVLYKYRTRVVPNEQELRLLLASWVAGAGPALFWLLRAPGEKTLQWLREESGRSTHDDDARLRTILLRLRLGGPTLDDDDISAFRGYKHAVEFADLIENESLILSRRALKSSLRHERGEVRAAATRAVVRQIQKGDWGWISELRKSSSSRLRQTYELLAWRPEVPIPNQASQNSRPLREFALLKGICTTRRWSHEVTLSPPRFKELIGGYEDLRGCLCHLEAIVGKDLREAERAAAP